MHLSFFPGTGSAMASVTKATSATSRAATTAFKAKGDTWRRSPISSTVGALTPSNSSPAGSSDRKAKLARPQLRWWNACVGRKFG